MTDSDRPENTERPAGPVTRDVQARIEIADRTRELNGFTVRDDRAALARAREIDTDPSVCSDGALRGWVGVVKDNIHVAGLVNSAGSPGLQNFVPTEDAPAVAAVREAGAILLGKANMHELAFGATSNNPTYGPVRNPFDHSRSVGGSSGGTAALVASGAARFGLGTDTGGSVRIPASLAGLYGLRPSTGRYSGHGVTPISPSRDTVGAMASTLADLDVVDRVLAPGDASRSEPAHEVRLGVPTSGHTEMLDDYVRSVWNRSLAALTSAGVVIVPVDLDEVDRLEKQWGMALVIAEVYPALSDYLAEFTPTVSLDALIEAVADPVVAHILSANRPESESDRAAVQVAARAGRDRIRDAYAHAFESARIDAILAPTTPVAAPLIGVEDEQLVVAGRTVDTFATLLHSASAGSFAGLPGMTVPAGRSGDGLPIGLSVDGPVGADRQLFAVATVVDDALER